MKRSTTDGPFKPHGVDPKLRRLPQPPEGSLEAAKWLLRSRDVAWICFRRSWLRSQRHLPTRNENRRTTVPFRKLTKEDREAKDWCQWFCGRVVPCCFRGRFE